MHMMKTELPVIIFLYLTSTVMQHLEICGHFLQVNENVKHCIVIVFCRDGFSMQETIERYRKHAKDTRTGLPSIEEDVEVCSISDLLFACPLICWLTLPGRFSIIKKETVRLVM